MAEDPRGDGHTGQRLLLATRSRRTIDACLFQHIQVFERALCSIKATVCVMSANEEEGDREKKEEEEQYEDVVENDK